VVSQGKNTGVRPVFPLASNKNEFHNDFILVAAWQSSSKCVNLHVNELEGETVTVKGLNVGANYKCSYKFTVKEGKGAPAFRLSEMDFIEFNFHWLEFETTSLDNYVPNIQDAAFYLGNTPGGKWPFPIKRQIVS